MDDMLIEVTTGVINHQLEAVSKRLSGEIKSLWQKHISSFKKYVINANKRYEATKTLLYKDRAVLIREMYVGTNIKRVNQSISEVTFVRELLEGNRCVVTAPAGAGKSFFAKSVFLRILSGKESIPLFIELRNLNGTDFGFLEYLQHDLKSNYKIDIPKSNLIELIESGRFTLILVSNCVN